MGTLGYCQVMLSAIFLTSLCSSQLRMLHAASEMWYMEYYVPFVRRLCMVGRQRELQEKMIENLRNVLLQKDEPITFTLVRNAE